jgi:hypothetical protein
MNHDQDWMLWEALSDQADQAEAMRRAEAPPRPLPRPATTSEAVMGLILLAFIAVVVGCWIVSLIPH